MGFAKDELKLPLTSPPPPQFPPSRRRGCFRFHCDLCMYLVLICHMLFFLTISLPSFTSLFPRPPIFHLISAEFNLTSLTDAGFSGAWKLDFNISNPPDGAFVSIVPVSASVISTVRGDVILADTDDVTLAQGAALADAIQTHARALLLSPPNQRLDDAVLGGISEDRAHGFVRFDVEITVNVEFIRRNLPVWIPTPNVKAEYRVICKEVEFRFADEERKFGVAETAPGMCYLTSSLEEVMGKFVFLACRNVKN